MTKIKRGWIRRWGSYAGDKARAVEKPDGLNRRKFFGASIGGVLMAPTVAEDIVKNTYAGGGIEHAAIRNLMDKPTISEDMLNDVSNLVNEQTEHHNYILQQLKNYARVLKGEISEDMIEDLEGGSSYAMEVKAAQQIDGLRSVSHSYKAIMADKLNRQRKLKAWKKQSNREIKEILQNNLHPDIYERGVKGLGLDDIFPKLSKAYQENMLKAKADQMGARTAGRPMRW